MSSDTVSGSATFWLTMRPLAIAEPTLPATAAPIVFQGGASPRRGTRSRGRLRGGGVVAPPPAPLLRRFILLWRFLNFLDFIALSPWWVGLLARWVTRR